MGIPRAIWLERFVLRLSVRFRHFEALLRDKNPLSFRSHAVFCSRVQPPASCTCTHLSTVQNRLDLPQRLVVLPFGLECLRLCLDEYLNLSELVKVEVPFFLQSLEVSAHFLQLVLQLGDLVHSPATNGGTTSCACGARGRGKGLYSV